MFSKLFSSCSLVVLCEGSDYLRRFAKHSQESLGTSGVEQLGGSGGAGWVTGDVVAAGCEKSPNIAQNEVRGLERKTSFGESEGKLHSFAAFEARSLSREIW